MYEYAVGYLLATAVLSTYQMSDTNILFVSYHNALCARLHVGMISCSGVAGLIIQEYGAIIFVELTDSITIEFMS